jgi:hypothetical protein
LGFVFGTSGTALGQATAEPSEAKKAEGAADTAASSSAPVSTPPKVAVQTGAPQPQGQNLASPLPAAPTAAPVVVKVGGSMILLYSNNYAPDHDILGNKKKHAVDVWRAGIVMDTKADRFGLHMELRVRDRNLRWSPVNSWTEELYASVDIIKATNPFGPLTLKVGKSFMQFGRFWDNSFYGSIQLRDGLKLDANWGLSLEGTVGATKKFGARYFAQYYLLDGQVNTANQNRDAPAILNPVAPSGGTALPIGARRRERVVLKVEPFVKFSETSFLRVGGSFDYFTVDYPDSQSPAAIAAKSRVKDLDNTNNVMRYGADFIAQVAWFGVWGEYIRQDGASTNAFPIASRADNPATPDVNEKRDGSSSDDVSYFMAGGNVTYDRYTLQYNFNKGIYRDIIALDALPGRMRADQPRQTHEEWIHNPSAQVKVNDQIRLILEFPMWFRKPIAGLLKYDPESKVATTTGREKKEVVEKQVLLTLHGKF